jgi:hypothetical protein
MREYHYRVDREGRVFHDDTEILDAPTLRFFLLAMQRTPDGRYLVVCQGERNWFAAEDTPFVVQRLGLTEVSGRLVAVDLHLAGDHCEALDPATLETDGGQLYCRVRRGQFRARLGRIAVQQLAPFLAEEDSRPVLVLRGARLPIREFAGRLTDDSARRPTP